MLAPGWLIPLAVCPLCLHHQDSQNHLQKISTVTTFRVLKPTMQKYPKLHTYIYCSLCMFDQVRFSRAPPPTVFGGILTRELDSGGRPSGPRSAQWTPVGANGAHPVVSRRNTQPADSRFWKRGSCATKKRQQRKHGTAWKTLSL